MICGPEIARIVNEFEENMPSRRRSETVYLHPEQTKRFHDKFPKLVVSLVSLMEGLENSFLENDENSVRLDTKDIPENIV